MAEAVCALRGRMRLAFAMALLLLSGFAGLLYQLIWIRQLTVLLGATVQALSLVLVCFMLGLAVGGYLGGWLGDRSVSRRNPLRVYGWLEIGLAVYVLLGLLAARGGWTGPVVGDWLWQGGVPRWTAGLWLLVPTTLMGATFPVLAPWARRYGAQCGGAQCERAQCHGAQGDGTRRDGAERVGDGQGVSWLYAASTGGAVVGCLAAAYFLIPQLGLSGCLLLAASGNAVAGVAAIVAGRVWSWEPAGLGRVELAGPSREATGTRALTDAAVGWRVATAALASGFGFLSLEVLWTRMLIQFLSANVLVTGTVLAGFLLGAALAAAAVARWARSATRDSVRWSQPVWLLLSASLLVAASLWGQPVAAGLFARCLGASGGWQAWRTELCLLALLGWVVVHSFLPGLVFPRLLAGLAAWPVAAGYAGRVGRACSLNLLGAILGCGLLGLFGLQWIGLHGSLLLVAAAYAAAACLVASRWAGRVAAATTLSLCAVLLCIPSVRQPVYWLNHGFRGVQRIPPAETVFLSESAESTVGVWRRGATLVLSVDGLVVADSSPMDLWDLLLKAHLPLLLHEDPREVCLVGLGAGVSTGAVASYPQVERIDCVELSPPVAEACRYFAQYNDAPWRDARFELHIEDGRRFLAATRRQYDVLSVDPVDPPVCNLYTRDFFQLCHDRLRPGGLMTQWLPLFRLAESDLRIVIRSFLDVFPETTLWYDGTSLLLVGSRDRPLAVDEARVSARISQPGVQRNLARIGRPSAALVLATYVSGPPTISRLLGTGVPTNTDDRPLLEYRVLRAEPPLGRQLADNLQRLVAVQDPWPSVPGGGWSREGRAPSDLERSRALMQALLQVRMLALRGQHQEGRRRLKAIAREYQLWPPQLRLLQPFIDELDWEELDWDGLESAGLFLNEHGPELGSSGP